MKLILKTAAVVFVIFGLAMWANVVFAAETLTVAAGKKGGGYDRAAQSFATRLAQRGLGAEVVNHDGSDAITLALCNGAADIGWTQIDGIYKRATEGCQLKPVAVYGNGEIAVILFPPKSKMDELSDLDAGSKVLVDTIGSGTELFWRTITGIEMGDDGTKDDWAMAAAVTDVVSMANTLAEFGDIDAVVMVRTIDSADITNLLGLGWSLGELWDRDIDDLEFNGKPLYASVKERIAGDKFWGYGVSSFVVVTDALARDRDTYRTVQATLQ